MATWLPQWKLCTCPDPDPNSGFIKGGRKQGIRFILSKVGTRIRVLVRGTTRHYSNRLDLLCCDGIFQSRRKVCVLYCGSAHRSGTLKVVRNLAALWDFWELPKEQPLLSLPLFDMTLRLRYIWHYQRKIIYKFNYFRFKIIEFVIMTVTHFTTDPIWRFILF